MKSWTVALTGVVFAAAGIVLLAGGQGVEGSVVLVFGLALVVGGLAMRARASGDHSSTRVLSVVVLLLALVFGLILLITGPPSTGYAPRTPDTPTGMRILGGLTCLAAVAGLVHQLRRRS